jgi:ectoine hydroxylase-related dioxygenase (phytanoyl-CoA dioxygenase family)
MNGLRK